LVGGVRKKKERNYLRAREKIDQIIKQERRKAIKKLVPDKA